MVFSKQVAVCMYLLFMKTKFTYLSLLSSFCLEKNSTNCAETDSVRLFTCKKLRYVWDDQYGGFTKLQGFDFANTHNLHQSKGLSLFQQCQR